MSEGLHAIFTKYKHRVYDVQKDDFLLRTHVTTIREACADFRTELKALSPTHFFTFATFCECQCHKEMHVGGQNSEACCEDCFKDLGSHL
jgi:hypothetical protein